MPPATTGPTATMAGCGRTSRGAAAGLGLRPVFIRRPLEWGPGAAPEAPPALDDLIDADGLTHLAGQLGC